MKPQCLFIQPYQSFGFNLHELNLRSSYYLTYEQDDARGSPKEHVNTNDKILGIVENGKYKVIEDVCLFILIKISIHTHQNSDSVRKPSFINLLR